MQLVEEVTTDHHSIISVIFCPRHVTLEVAPLKLISSSSLQSKDAGIRALVMLDEQGGNFSSTLCRLTAASG